MPDVLSTMLTGYDYFWDRVENRLAGLTDAEYLWEPVREAWSVREVDGQWRADRSSPEPDPPPVTTIAWRMWHIASDCLAGYVRRLPGGRPIEVTGTDWYGQVEPAMRDLRAAAAGFRRAMVALGEDGMWRQLGPDWGPFAESTWADLFLHANDELVHHGAEIALLRDLYAWREPAS